MLLVGITHLLWFVCTMQQTSTRDGSNHSTDSYSGRQEVLEQIRYLAIAIYTIILTLQYISVRSSVGKYILSHTKYKKLSSVSA